MPEAERLFSLLLPLRHVPDCLGASTVQWLARGGPIPAGMAALRPMGDRCGVCGCAWRIGYALSEPPNVQGRTATYDQHRAWYFPGALSSYVSCCQRDALLGLFEETKDMTLEEFEAMKPRYDSLWSTVQQAANAAWETALTPEV